MDTRGGKHFVYMVKIFKCGHHMILISPINLCIITAAGGPSNAKAGKRSSLFISLSKYQPSLDINAMMLSLILPLTMINALIQKAIHFVQSDKIVRGQKALRLICVPGRRRVN